MKRTSRRIAQGALLLLPVVMLTGCPKAPKVAVPPAPPPSAKPTFEKTFGEITTGGLSTLLIQYKSITLLTDPVFEPVGPLGGGALRRTQPPALSLETLPSVDYLLLSDSQPHHWGAKAREGLRKNLKILASPEAAGNLQKSGFVQAKGLSKGQRILLKKNEDFLFVSVLQSRNPVSGELANGYLLEFDNGRNIFLSGEIVDESVVREFVYDLRDDGKQLEMAFIYAGGLHKGAEKAWQSCNEDLAAVFIGLLQPRVALILQAEGLDGASNNRAQLQTRLEEQIFSGELYIPASGEKIPF